MKNPLDPISIEPYMHGACHIHAIASERAHGGSLSAHSSFAICYDDAEIYFDYHDGFVPSVVHVWSVHDTPDGPVARDATAEIPLTIEAMQGHIEAFFPEMQAKFQYGDAWIDTQVTLSDIEDLSGDGDHQPLAPSRKRPSSPRHPCLPSPAYLRWNGI